MRGCIIAPIVAVVAEFDPEMAAKRPQATDARHAETAAQPAEAGNRRRPTPGGAMPERLMRVAGQDEEAAIARRRENDVVNTAEKA